MHILKDSDYLEVKLNSLVADYDRLILTNLYQPIIGYKAVGLYFTLLTEVENQKINPIIEHKSLFNRMQINASDFVDSRKYLEAVGLLKTFVSDLKGNKLYQYELYAPKTPKLFFDNTLLYGMLIKSIGEVDAGKLKNIYTINSHPEGTEITASFMEVFAPDFDDPAFKKAMEGSGGIITRQTAKLDCGFSYELFFAYLNNHSQIKPEAFSKKTMKEIERLATLYGIDEESAAQAVIELYNPKASKDERVDFEELAERFKEQYNFQYLYVRGGENRTSVIRSETDLARKINLMEKLSPRDFLAVLQNGVAPANVDLKLLNDLSGVFKLPNCVINALVDYVLTINDNILARPLVEKIAASLVREGVKTTIDAMNYLKKNKIKKKKSGKDDSNESNDTTGEESAPETTKKIDRQALLDSLKKEEEDNGED